MTRSCCDGRCPPCVDLTRNRLLRNIAPLMLPTPSEGAAAGEGDGGMSPTSPAGHIRNTRRGGRP